MARFGSLGTQYFDNSGDPLVDGLIDFYEPGTTTRKNTYSDINLTIANTNPVELTATGRQPNVFFAGTAKAVLKTAAGVVIETRDPVGDTSAGAFSPYIVDFNYPVGALVTDENGDAWASIDTPNIGNEPSASPLFWESAISYLLKSPLLVPAGQLAVGSAADGLSGLDITAKGSIVVGDGDDPVEFPVGDNGDIIVADSAEPSGMKWRPLNEPGLTLLSTVTASTSATVDIETTFSSTYDAYVIVATGVTVSSNNVDVYLRMKLGGSYAASNYNFHVDRSDSSSASYASLNSASASQITLGACGSSAACSARFDIRVDLPTSTTLAKQVYWTGATMDGGLTGAVASGQGLNTATTALTGIRIFPQAGTIVSGKFRLYGIKN